MNAAERLSRVVSRIKGAEYTIDSRVSAGYLVGTVIERALMMARGIVRFPGRSPRPFVGSRVTLKSKKDIRFGAGTTFGHRSAIDALSVRGVSFGANCSVGRNTRIEGSGSLKHLGQGFRAGDDVGLGTDCLYGCAGGIEIGSDTIVGNFVSFHSENHQIADLDQPIRLQGVTHQGISIGRNCWIGAKSTILDGAHVGDGCVIAAGSVVLAGTYPDHGIYGGIPAKLLKERT